MSKYFGATVREPITVSFNGKSHQFFVRELGFVHRQQIFIGTGFGLNPAARSAAIMNELVIASVEEQDGSKSYDSDSWLEESREVSDQLYVAVKKANHIGVDESPEQTAEEAAKNS
jgi:hypothetical protein